MSEQIPQFIRDALPDADDAALQAALENFKTYMRIVARIHQRLLTEALDDSTNPPDRVRIPKS